jgi:hypothetical protein
VLADANVIVTGGWLYLRGDANTIYGANIFQQFGGNVVFGGTPISPLNVGISVDRATAIGNGPIELDDLKIIVLMVFWSLGEEPDALILDELFVMPEDRLIH